MATTDNAAVPSLEPRRRLTDLRASQAPIPAQKGAEKADAAMQAAARFGQLAVMGYELVTPMTEATAPSKIALKRRLEWRSSRRSVLTP